MLTYRMRIMHLGDDCTQVTRTAAVELGTDENKAREILRSFQPLTHRRLRLQLESAEADASGNPVSKWNADRRIQ